MSAAAHPITSSAEPAAPAANLTSSDSTQQGASASDSKTASIRAPKEGKPKEKKEKKGGGIVEVGTIDMISGTSS